MLPLIVSFYTNDWEYPIHAARLKRECGRLLESWGAARVLVLRNGSDEDWVYQWPR